ncbi:hypothetical protein IMZ48_00065 [Candidatus Bathyarchaeota archaeon]|nr:hypothetical protein [Candidatus Bathyarchaeota archaeon]
MEVGRYLDANGELIFTNLETGTALDTAPLSPGWDGESSRYLPIPNTHILMCIHEVIRVTANPTMAENSTAKSSGKAQEQVPEKDTNAPKGNFTLNTDDHANIAGRQAGPVPRVPGPPMQRKVTLKQKQEPEKDTRAHVDQPPTWEKAGGGSYVPPHLRGKTSKQ